MKVPPKAGKWLDLDTQVKKKDGDEEKRKKKKK